MHMTLRSLTRTRVPALAAALAVAFLCTAADASAQRMKAILDTDIGGDIDDAWALGLAMQSPALELVGVTITDGNTPARAKVACKLLHAGGRDDVPVAVGRKTHDHVEFQFAWAEDFAAKVPVTQPAADFIIETVRKQPGEITLVAVGPLQNVADALRKDPAIAKLFKRVVLMSGSIAASAWSSTHIPEWNVVSSTADAQVVYAAGLPLTTVPLDSTTYVTLKDDERDRLLKHDSPVTRSLEALYRLWIETYASPVMQEKSVQMCALLDRLAADTDPTTRARLARHYYACSRDEWMFFDMGWRKEEWPV